MRITALLFACLAATACGGGSKPKPARAFAPPDPADEGPDPGSEHRRKPPPPPPPNVWHAKAELAPVRGVKMKAAIVTFTQTEGEQTQIASEIAGLKRGTYHLLVHEGDACGKNAKKAGAVWEMAASIDLTVTVEKGGSGDVDEATDVALDGDSSIIGHTLVLHADKKGKPGKAVACGAIASDEASDEAADQ